jgi:hypothetical protein
MRRGGERAGRAPAPAVLAKGPAAAEGDALLLGRGPLRTPVPSRRFAGGSRAWAGRP